MNITPILYLTRRVLKPWQKLTYQDVSEKSWELCPPCTERASRPAIYLEGQFEKVTKLRGEQMRGRQASLIAGTWYEYRPTIAYQLKNVFILNGFVYKGAMKYAWLPLKEQLIGTGKADFFRKAALAATYTGYKFFAHFIWDDIPLNIAARNFGEALTPARKPYDHEPRYRELTQVYAQEITQVQCDELIIIDDVAQNQFKKQRYDFIRSQIKAQINPLQEGHGVFVRRGTSGTRRVLDNEVEVENFLKAKYDFIAVDPQKMTVDEIYERALGAKIVVGVEGSHMVHSLFSMANHASMLIIQPPFRFDSLYKEMLDCLDMYYAFVVGDETGEGSFTVSLEDLARTLDKVEAATSSSYF